MAEYYSAQQVSTQYYSVLLSTTQLNTAHRAVIALDVLLLLQLLQHNTTHFPLTMSDTMLFVICALPLTNDSILITVILTLRCHHAPAARLPH